MNLLKTLTASLAVLMLGSFAQAAPPQVAAQVDLNKYLGDWYEIAAIPQWFQKDCVGNVKATYSLSGEKKNDLKVVNSCQTEKGLKVAEGRGRISDRTSNAKIDVTFARVAGFWIYAASGEYWILDVAPDYSTAVVSNSNRSTAWILSRTKFLQPDVLASLEIKLKEQGIDTCKLLTTIQDGGLQQKLELCKIAQKEAAPSVDVTDVLSADGRFSTLMEAVQVAGLTEMFKVMDPATLFAPTNSAFQKLPADVWKNILMNKENLKAVLLNHVLAAQLTSSQIATMSSLTTLSGGTLKVRTEGGDIFVNDAKLVIKDLQAKNGVIHAVDTVLLP